MLAACACVPMPRPLLLAVALFLGASVVSCGSPLSTEQERQEETATATAKQKPMEYMLATINNGSSVNEDDISVTRFRYLLEQLHKETGYKKQRIGDITVLIWKEVRDKYGKDVSLLQFMSEERKSYLQGAGIKYEEALSFLAVLIGNQ